MLRTNEDNIVEFLLQCQPGPPRTRGNWGVSHDGAPFILPSIGGITLNLQVGDPASGCSRESLRHGARDMAPAASRCPATWVILE